MKRDSLVLSGVGVLLPTGVTIPDIRFSYNSGTGMCRKGDRAEARGPTQVGN